MDNEVQLKLGHVPLEAVCAEQGQPFIHISPGNKDLTRTLKCFGGDIQAPYRATPMYCGRVRDVVIFGRSYITYEPGLAVLRGQAHRDHDIGEFVRFYVNDIMQEQRSRPEVMEECCFLGGQNNFGHFIFDFLCRLPAFERAGVLHRFPLVVHDDLDDVWLSFLELYGVARERIIKVPRLPASHYKSDWITACPNVYTSDTYSFWDDGIHDMRRKLLANSGGVGPEKVFLGRRGARHRRLVNEDELWAFLESRGFAYPDFTGLKAAEQIRQVRSAKVIVSIAGAGSTITYFAPENCAIIELCPPGIAGGFASLGGATVIGQTFGRIPTEIVKDDTKQMIDFDMTIDIAVVSQIVDGELRRQGI